MSGYTRTNIYGHINGGKPSLMEYFLTDNKNPDSTVLFKASQIINEGGILIYPTDTLYGMGVDIFNDQAFKRLYNVKQRDLLKPISIMVNDIASISDFVGGLSDFEKKYAEKLYPGKVTLLFKVKNNIDLYSFTDRSKIGFRIPDSIICKKLIENVGHPITTTSVNISKSPSHISVKLMMRDFADKIDGILDVGFLNPSIGSTVIDLTTKPATIFRYGDVTISELKNSIDSDFSTNFSGNFVVTFVCSGNICRSPMAEGILKKILDKTRFRKIVTINSAGTLKLPATPADFNAIDVSKKNTIDIHSHRSKPINIEIMRESNIIICMALEHYSFLKKKYPEFKNKILLLKQYKSQNQLFNPSVADPIGHDFTFFENIFNEIQKEIKRILPHLLNEIKHFARENNITLS